LGFPIWPKPCSTDPKVMLKHNLQIGQVGEEIAKEYLEKKGFKILERNYKTKYGETDIIAKCGKELVFVEVRTKIGENFGTPEDSLNKRKLRKLWLNARAGKATRIDAVCIVLNNNLTVERLNHYENIL